MCWLVPKIMFGKECRVLITSEVQVECLMFHMWEIKLFDRSKAGCYCFLIAAIENICGSHQCHRLQLAVDVKAKLQKRYKDHTAGRRSGAKGSPRPLLAFGIMFIVGGGGRCRVLISVFWPLGNVSPHKVLYVSESCFWQL